MSDTSSFFDRLDAKRAHHQTTLCVGIDPRPDQIPERLWKSAGPHLEDVLARFGIEVMELTADVAACFKPQIAFFEQHGLPGLRAFARILTYAREHKHLVIADVKRGDIGSTATAYARAFLEPGGDFEVDAITVNPYLGRDSLEPFVQECVAHAKGMYVLLRTSNGGARDLQELALKDGASELLLHRVATMIAQAGADHVSEATGLSCVGAVVGATAPSALAELRERMPSTAFLVPGFGAQGATAQDVAAATRVDGSGAVVNSSRGIIHPKVPDGKTWNETVRASALRARDELYEAQVATR